MKRENIRIPAKALQQAGDIQGKDYNRIGFPISVGKGSSYLWAPKQNENVQKAGKK